MNLRFCSLFALSVLAVALGDESADLEAEKLELEKQEFIETQKAFLEENANKEGVVELESGLQYKVIESSTEANAKQPELKTLCRIHYEGKLIDGTVFDSSYERGDPLVITPSQVIKGWSELLLLMSEGDKWEAFIPAELAYGERGAGEKIPANAALVFTVEVVEVDPEFEGFEKVKYFMTKEIPGLPISLQVWQVIMLLFYIGVQYFTNRGSSSEKASARHILVGEEDLAKTILSKIQKKKATFEEMAQEHSTCPSGKKGGDLGEFSPGQMVAEFDAVCFDPKVTIGKVQGPIKTQFGYHLIIVDSRTGPESAGKAQPDKKKK
uniref:peptidylprolyl isomerase n=1 Tax=Mucochytrium quahogii TaxID=96639 RepID=A0A7S2RLC9_9STRA|mmetsp:Transcript_19049/g.31183  ORF Transcript_19049/g.31183 Transcript_19049/m.31183 type:complete len:324 (+) Transcript_19049:151-1122(+)